MVVNFKIFLGEHARRPPSLGTLYYSMLEFPPPPLSNSPLSTDLIAHKGL